MKMISKIKDLTFYKKKKFYIILTTVFSVLLVADIVFAAVYRDTGRGFNIDDEVLSSISGGEMPEMPEMGGDFSGGMPEMGGNFGGSGGFPGGDAAAQDTGSGSFLSALRSHAFMIGIILAIADAFSITMIVIISRREKKRERAERKAEAEKEGRIYIERKPVKKQNPKWMWAVPVVIMILIVMAVKAVSASGKTAEISVTEASDLSGTVETGTIADTLYGAGTVSAGDTENVTLVSGVEIDTWYVSDGDTVAEGDILASVDTVSVMSAIVNLQETIEQLDEEIASHEDEEISDTVTATAQGRIKAVYAAEDGEVTAIMNENGALALISLDGLMAVSIESDIPVAGEAVTVVLSGGEETDGKVESSINGTAVIVLTDEGTEIGEEVTVYDETGEVLGSSTLYIHSELRVTGFSGTVESVSISEEEEVEVGDTLFTLTDTDYTAEYESLISQRNELEDYMQTLFRLYMDGYLYAPAGGVVSGVGDEGGTQAEAEDLQADSEEAEEAETEETETEETDEAGEAEEETDAESTGGNDSGEADAGIEKSELEITITPVETVLLSTSGDVDTQTTDTSGKAPDTQQGDMSGSTSDIQAGDTPGTAPDTQTGGMTGSTTGAQSGDTSGSTIGAQSGDTLDSVSDTQADGTQYIGYVRNITAAGTAYTVTLETASGNINVNVEAGRTVYLLSSGGISVSDAAAIKEGSVLIYNSDTYAPVYVISSGSTGSTQNDSNLSGDGELSGMSGDGTTGDSPGNDSIITDGTFEDVTGSNEESTVGSLTGDSASGSVSYDYSQSDETDEAVDAIFDISESTVCTLTSDREVTVEITIDELDILSVEAGQKAQVTLDAIPGQSFEGTVTAVNTEGTNAGGNSKYTAEITLEKTEDMLAGMNASVSIVISEKEDVLMISENAIFEDGTTTYVYTSFDAESGTYSGITEVETGVSDGENVEILSGLSEGDTYYYSLLDTVNYTRSIVSGSGGMLNFNSMFGRKNEEQP